MAGYSWKHGMSNNAVYAYAKGCMPLSKWTKKAILERLKDILQNNPEILPTLAVFQKKRKEELQQILVCTEWHHTSSYFNRTYFYRIDEGMLTSLDENASQINCKPCPKAAKEDNMPLVVIVVANWGGTRNHPIRLENSTHVGVQRGNFVHTKDGKFKVGAARMVKIKQYNSYAEILHKYPNFEDNRDFLSDFYKKYGKVL